MSHAVLADAPSLPPKLRFLVVDDFETIRQVTAHQLRSLGAESVFLAKDGIQALAVLRKQPVDVVISDWSMPHMDGLALLAALRGDPKHANLPFILVTGEPDRSLAERAVSLGVNGVLLKPYSAAQLFTRISRALPALGAMTVRGTVSGDISTVEKAAPARPTILVVDDVPDNLMLLSQLFKADYRVRMAHNGQKALTLCTGDDPPDLVLLDVMMPGMDGFEVARRMREHPAAEAIPIIFVTALTAQDARSKGLDLGAVDYITKPVNPDWLRPKVRNLMRYVQMRKDLQLQVDDMVEAARLREQIEHMSRQDLKAPMASVLGTVQTLLTDEDLTHRQRDQLQLTEEAALAAINILNLSSELHKIETARFEFDPQPVAIAEMLRRMVETLRLVFAPKNLTLAVDTDVPVGETPPKALGDATLCYSLMVNLLKNACEAAPEGTRVQVTLFSEDPLRITLVNTGVVPNAIRERFFDKYVSAGKLGGLGLGTYSARLLTRAQGGEVSMEVDDEANTTCVTVQLKRAS